jgi:hypothetical protein
MAHFAVAGGEETRTILERECGVTEKTIEAVLEAVSASVEGGGLTWFCQVRLAAAAAKDDQKGRLSSLSLPAVSLSHGSRRRGRGRRGIRH